MATIKSYTDLSQSKTLSKILPPESADMYYFLSRDESMNIIYSGKPLGFFDKTQVAWSLAALLGVLQDYTLQTNTDGTVFVVCESKKPMISDAYNNPIDACVAMIERLHELNLL